MKLNRNGMSNLALIIACIAVVIMIMAGVTPQYVFGIIGIYAIYMGWQTIHYKEVPNRKDYGNVRDKDRFCIHTGVWMLLLGICLIGLCVALTLGMADTYFWGGVLLAIILAFFYNFVVNRIFVIGFKSNLEKVIDLLKHAKR